MSNNAVQGISILYFFGVISLYILYLYSRKSGISSQLTDDGTEVSDDKIMYIHYRGECITMTYFEFLNNWSNMNREQKNILLENQMKKIKQGLVRRVFVNNSDYKIELTEKGRHLGAAIKLKKDVVNKAD